MINVLKRLGREFVDRDLHIFLKALEIELIFNIFPHFLNRLTNFLSFEFGDIFPL